MRVSTLQNPHLGMLDGNTELKSSNTGLFVFTKTVSTLVEDIRKFFPDISFRQHEATNLPENMSSKKSQHISEVNALFTHF